MTKETFQKILPHIWRHEGGYVNDRYDPGGATNMGITHRTLARWRGVRSVTRQQVKDLKREEAAEIYKKRYWDAVNADQLPVGVDYSTFDMGVNAGPSRGVKILQKSVGSYPDGKIGPITRSAINNMTQWGIIGRYYTYRMQFYKRLRTFRRYGRGWTNRAKNVRLISWRLTK